MDLVIRGATVYDGTGADGVVADVGVTNDRIESVAAADMSAGVEVDATGLALAPGFIDVHSHDDFAVFLTPEMDFKVGQGVTTDIVGNCGLGAAPFNRAVGYLAFFNAADRSDDLPRWSGYRSYLDAIDADPPSLNVAALAGHGTIRLAAMGVERRAPSDKEFRAMRELVAEAVAAGVVGMSSGLIYEPGRYAATEELVELATTLAGSGALYATHMRNEGDRLLDAVGEAIRIGREGGVPVQISHHKATGKANWGRVRDSLALIDAARRNGLDVTADQYPYTAGSTSLYAVMQNAREGENSLGDGTDEIVLASAPSRPDWEGRSLTDLGSEFGCTAMEAGERALEALGQTAVVVIHSMCDDDIRTVLRHPTTMVGSDGVPTLGGKPHPRLYGTFAKVLGHYSRDEAVLPLPEAVHRMTGMPAAKFGLRDRGVIAPGRAADLVLFDPATIADVATYDDPHHNPTGIHAVWVNGTAVFRAGEHTGARPGRALRRA